MKKPSQFLSSQLQTTENVLTIPRPVFDALHPLHQLMARSLEKIGKVQIVEESEQINAR